MSMNDQDSIEKILQQTKISSISDIVNFITNRVSEYTCQTLQQFDIRIQELENPKGMDRVMLEEVKALVEAMIDQREDDFRKDVEKMIKENISSSGTDPEPSLRSLNQIDFLNLMNMHNPKGQKLNKKDQRNRGCSLINKFTSSELISPSENKICSTESFKTDLYSEIKILKDQIDRLSDKKPFQEIKLQISTINKEMINKVSFQETEKIIIRFQRQIFNKIAQQKQQMTQLSQQILKLTSSEYLKNKFVDEIFGKNKQSIAKVQKKYKKLNQQIETFCKKIQNYRIQNYEIKQELMEIKYKHKQEIGALQNILQDLVDEKETLLIKQSNRNSFELSAEKPILQNHLSKALWISENLQLKNGSIVWSKQLKNTDHSNYEFEEGKSSIKVEQAGYYQVRCFSFGTKRPIISLQLNSEIIGKCEQRSISHPLGTIASSIFSQIVYMKQGKNLLSLKVQNNEQSGNVLLQIQKFF